MLCILAAGLLGAAAGFVLVSRDPPTLDEIERQAKADNEEAAFEYVYDHDRDSHELLEATIAAMYQRARKNWPTPQEVAAYRVKWREYYRQRWLRERHSTVPASSPAAATQGTGHP